MASQQVIDKLEVVQNELDKLSIAVTHIDEASKVAKSASEILKNIPMLLTDLKAIEETHRKDLLSEHKNKIVALEKQINILIVELNTKTPHLNELIEEIKKLGQSISTYLVEIQKINFPERLSKIDNQISAINIGIGNLQTAIQNTQTKIDAIQLSVTSYSQVIDNKISDLNNKLAYDNSLVRKEIRTNRIITISAGIILIIGIVLILVLCHK